MNDLDQNNDNGQPATPSAAPATDDLSARIDALKQEYVEAPTATAEPAAPASSAFESPLPAGGGQLEPIAVDTALAGADVIREQDKIMLVLAYLFPFVPFFTVKDSAYVKWHASQGLALWVTCVVGSIILGIIPLIGCVASPLFGIAVMIACIKGIIEALKPARWEIPIVGSVAKKLFG